MLCQNLKASVKFLGSRVEAAVMVLASLQFIPGWIAGVGNRTQDKLAKLHPCITHGWRFLVLCCAFGGYFARVLRFSPLLIISKSRVWFYLN